MAVEVGGATGTKNSVVARQARFSFNAPRVRAVRLLYPPLLDGDTTRMPERVPEKTRGQSDKALANARGIESKESCRSFE